MRSLLSRHAAQTLLNLGRTAPEMTCAAPQCRDRFYRSAHERRRLHRAESQYVPPHDIATAAPSAAYIRMRSRPLRGGFGHTRGWPVRPAGPRGYTSKTRSRQSVDRKLRPAVSTWRCAHLAVKSAVEGKLRPVADTLGGPRPLGARRHDGARRRARRRSLSRAYLQDGWLSSFRERRRARAHVLARVHTQRHSSGRRNARHAPRGEPRSKQLTTRPL